MARILARFGPVLASENVVGFDKYDKYGDGGRSVSRAREDF
jgi:hypothetical protein